MLTGEKMPGWTVTQPGGDGRDSGDGSAIHTNYTAKFDNRQPLNLRAALDYVELPEPYAIFPAWWVRQDGRCACGNPKCDRPGKHPIGKLVPHGFLDATTNPNTVRRWWAQYPRANIAWALPEHIGICDVDSAAWRRG